MPGGYQLRKAERPYSQVELAEVRARTLGRLRVGKVMVTHPSCTHFYFAKEGGKKEQRLLETGGDDAGSCSVCWKIKRASPGSEREEVQARVDDYQVNFAEKPDRWTFRLVELEKMYYRWLYYDPAQRRRDREEARQDFGDGGRERRPYRAPRPARTPRGDDPPSSPSHAIDMSDMSDFPALGS